MESLVAKGLVRAIGISNFTITKIENLLKTAKVVPAINQVENHPHFQQPKLKEYCSKKGMYSPKYFSSESFNLHVCILQASLLWGTHLWAALVVQR